MEAEIKTATAQNVDLCASQTQAAEPAGKRKRGRPRLPFPEHYANERAKALKRYYEVKKPGIEKERAAIDPEWPVKQAFLAEWKAMRKITKEQWMEQKLAEWRACRGGASNSTTASRPQAQLNSATQKTADGGKADDSEARLSQQLACVY